MLLHGLHDGEELVCQHSNVMEDDLEWEQETPELANCLSARHHTPEPRRRLPEIIKLRAEVNKIQIKNNTKN